MSWYQRFVVFVSSPGFTSSQSDCSLFTYHSSSDHIFLILYVDDIILIASSLTLILYLAL